MSTPRIRYNPPGPGPRARRPGPGGSVGSLLRPGAGPSGSAATVEGPVGCHGASCPAFFLDIYRARRARKIFRHMVTFAPFWATGETCRTETESALGDMSH